MKKIIKIIYICMLSFILLPSIVEGATVEVVNQEGIYSNRASNGFTYYGQFGYIYVDKVLSYCIEPLSIIGSYYVNDQSVLSKFDNDTLEYIKLIGNFNITNIYYYMAAQELIWEKVDNVEVYYTNKNFTQGDIINIDSYKNEIIDYVNKAYLTPDFGDISFNGDLGSTIELTDNNNVLSEYDIINNTSNIIWKDNNKLYVKIVYSNSFDFKLIREEIKNNSLGYSGNGQSLASLSNTYILEKKYSVNVNPYSTKISIDRYVSDKLVKGLITFKILNLNTSQYVTYNNSELFSTDELGVFNSEFKLTEGKYQIINQDIPEGFIYSETTIFEIKKEYYDGTDYFKVIDYLNKPVGIIEIRTYIETLEGLARSNRVNAYIYAESDIYDIRGSLTYRKGDLACVAYSDIGAMDIRILLGDYRIEFRDENDVLFNNDVYYVSLKYVDKYTEYDVYKLDANINFNEIKININTSFEGSDKSELLEYELYSSEDIYVNGILIYKKDDKVSNLEVDKSSELVSVQYLPYGKYYIKDINSFELYNNVDNIDIDFTKEKNIFDLDIYMELKNKIVEESKEEIINEEVTIEENKEVQVEYTNEILPKTSNYNLKYYVILVFVLLSNIGFLIKNENK